MAVLVWIVAVVGLAGVVATLRLPSPQHRIALGLVGIALALLFWPIECASAMGLAPEGVPVDSRTWCTSALGLRLPSEGGIGIVLGGVGLLAIVNALVRRRQGEPRP